MWLFLYRCCPQGAPDDHPWRGTKAALKGFKHPAGFCPLWEWNCSRISCWVGVTQVLRSSLTCLQVVSSSNTLSSAATCSWARLQTDVKWNPSWCSLSIHRAQPGYFLLQIKALITFAAQQNHRNNFTGLKNMSETRGRKPPREPLRLRAFDGRLTLWSHFTGSYR